jgi:hypothetical protein
LFVRLPAHLAPDHALRVFPFDLHGFYFICSQSRLHDRLVAWREGVLAPLPTRNDRQ